jgi:hypothetical protein
MPVALIAIEDMVCRVGEANENQTGIEPRALWATINPAINIRRGIGDFRL